MTRHDTSLAPELQVSKWLNTTRSPTLESLRGRVVVFEHHEVMGPDALEVFAYEYRLRFPIGIDKYAGEKSQGMPLTMEAYQMQGTPTLILIDKAGHVRLHKFGHVNDLMLGFSIGALLSEEFGGESDAEIKKQKSATETGCDEDGCCI